VSGLRVLLTGAAGSIGRVLTAGLDARGHDVIGLDLVPATEGDDRRWYVVDCTDPDAVRAVFAEERLDAVVHLAGNPGEASLPDALDSHVVTTAALLDAAVAHDVHRFVYASSNHAVGRTPRQKLGPDLLTVEARPRPDTFYGVGKVAAEALLSLYADRYAIDALACRIGSFLPEPTSTRHLSTWLSPDDCVRMFDACLTTPAPGFAVLYGISANTRAWWDLEPGRALGYRPADDAERFADRVEPAVADAAEGAHVGGPFTSESYYRPALDRQGGA
jgi:uronate dehydrogenase